jgi:hypothetical protein
LLYCLKKIFTREFDGIVFSELSFKPLSRSEVFDVIKRTKIIVDIEHPGQKGLTMRTIETLGGGRKLVTTNSSISDYDFFNERNACIIDRMTPLVPQGFKQSDYLSLNKVAERYSLKSWIAKVFSLKETE